MKILGQTAKPKVPVVVGKKVEQMTETQSYRFAQLNDGDKLKSDPTAGNPLEDLRYRLVDAAFRLMISEKELLQKAALGSIRLYTDATGLTGRWQRERVDADAVQSSPRRLKSGFLALDVKACAGLVTQGSTSVSVLELPGSANPAGIDLDSETLQTLSAWGLGNKQFLLEEPLVIDRNRVVLLSPLVLSNC